MVKRQTKLKDIAKAAGVDISTVSLCLNDSLKVSETTKQRIKGLAVDMNYSPNLTAKALRGGKSHTVGIGLATLSHPFFTSMLRSMASSFYKKHYFSLVTVIRNPDYEHIFDSMFQRNVDGLCLGNAVFYEEIIDLYKEFINSGKPLSFYIEKDMLSKMEGVDANYAVCDLMAGTEKVLQHLHDLNHRRIAIAGYIPNRHKAYCDFLNEKNIEFDERLVLSNWGKWVDDLSLEANLKSMLEMPDAPTAIFASSDQIAVRIMKILLKNEIKIPEDISIAGINDTPPMDMLIVPLTTLKIPVHEIGNAMAEMLLDQIHDTTIGPQKREIETELIVRESTARI